MTSIERQRFRLWLGKPSQDVTFRDGSNRVTVRHGGQSLDYLVTPQADGSFKLNTPAHEAGHRADHPDRLENWDEYLPGNGAGTEPPQNEILKTIEPTAPCSKVVAEAVNRVLTTVWQITTGSASTSTACRDLVTLCWLGGVGEDRNQADIARRFKVHEMLVTKSIRRLRERYLNGQELRPKRSAEDHAEADRKRNARSGWRSTMLRKSRRKR